MVANPAPVSTGLDSPHNRQMSVLFQISSYSDLIADRVCAAWICRGPPSSGTALQKLPLAGTDGGSARRGAPTWQSRQHHRPTNLQCSQDHGVGAKALAGFRVAVPSDPARVHRRKPPAALGAGVPCHVLPDPDVALADGG